jgi:hypothetical protein
MTALVQPEIGSAIDEALKAILGTWNETVKSTITGQSFQTFYTYSPGGGVTDTGQTDLTPASLAGPIHGTWVKTGERSLRWLVHAFSYDPQGNPNGIWNIRENITLNKNADAYSGTAHAEIIFGGAVVFGDTVNVVAAKVIP